MNPLGWVQSPKRIFPKSAVELVRVSWSEAMNPQSSPAVTDGSFEAHGNPSFCTEDKSYQKKRFAVLRSPIHKEVKLASVAGATGVTVGFTVGSTVASTAFCWSCWSRTFCFKIMDRAEFLSRSLPNEARVDPRALHSASAVEWSVSFKKSLKHLLTLSGLDHPRGHRLTYCSKGDSILYG